MNVRIKELRKALGLTQQEFADRIGSVQNTITGYETGRRAPSNQVVALICREFNVNEDWLRTGKGEMFLQRTRDAELTEFVDKLLAEETMDFRRRLVSALSRLSPQQWDALEAVALNLLADMEPAAEAQDAGKDIPAPTGQEWTQADLAAKVAELERQNQEKDKQLQELAAEVAAMKEEDARLGLMDRSSASPSASAGNRSPAEKAKK